MACSTGEACGLTDTRSSARSSENQSAVIRLTIEALEAWWPPTFTPERLGRTRLAWWTIAVASHSTRRSTDLSVSRSGVAGGGDGAVVVGEPLNDRDLPIPEREHDAERRRSLDAADPSPLLPLPLADDLVAVGLDSPDLDVDRLPGLAPRVYVRGQLLVADEHLLLGPFGARPLDGVLVVEGQGALDVAGVPALDEEPDDYLVVFGHARGMQGSKANRAHSAEPSAS